MVGLQKLSRPARWHWLNRPDPVLAVLVGKLAAKRADRAPLAGKSTLNRGITR
jgi:hypothetical protein